LSAEPAGPAIARSLIKLARPSGNAFAPATVQEALATLSPRVRDNPAIVVVLFNRCWAGADGGYASAPAVTERAPAMAAISISSALAPASTCWICRCD